MEKKAIIYTRVSDPSQIENNSLETQEDVCRRFAESKGFVVAKVFPEEGFSAKHTATRPKLLEALSYCYKKENKISLFIVYKFNRFSRNTEEGLGVISLLAKYGIEVVSATEISEMNPIGRAMRTVFMAFGQMENEVKGQTVKDNMLSVFRKGLWPFKPPIGYKRKFKTKEENKGLPAILDPNIAPIITKMFVDASKGIYSKSQLARMMNLGGFGDHYKVSGKPTEASHKIVKGILEKTFYYGYMYAPKWGEYSWGKHEPLIDEPTWQKAYHRLILKKRNYQYKDTELYPLKGALCCEACGHPMTTSPSKGNSGIVYYYECKQKNCIKLRINAQKAHQQFESLLTKIQPNSRVIKLFEHMVFREWDKVINQRKADVKRLEKKIGDLKEEFRSIRKAKDEEIYTSEEAKAEAERIRQEIQVTEIIRSDVKIEQYDKEIVKEFVEHFLNNLSLLWSHLDLAKRQAFLQKVFEGKIICTKNKEIRTAQLSPSFELIQAIKDQKVRKVPPPGIEPGFRV